MFTTLLLSHPIFCLCAVVIGIILIKYLQQLKQRQRLPPGPFPWPLVGNTLLFRGTKTPLYETIKRLTEIFGEPITIWFGTTPYIFLNTTETVRTALIDNQHDFASRPGGLFQELFLQNSRDIIFGKYDQIWAAHKKLANQAMRKIVDSERLEALASEGVAEIADKLLENHQKPIELGPYVTDAVWCVILPFIFGVKMEIGASEYRKFQKLQQRGQEITSDVMLFEAVPGITHFQNIATKLSSTLREIAENVGAQKQFSIDRFLDHKKSYQPDKIRDIVDALLYEQEQETKSGTEKNGKKSKLLDDDTVAMIIVDMFAAGTETSMIFLQFFFLEMILNPDLQEKCHQAIRQVCGDRPVSLKDRASLPLLEACICEALRVYPPAPFGVPHAPTKAAHLGEYWIDTNASLLINHFGVQHDPKYWKNANEFDPVGNFLDENGKVVKPPAWIPFGVGRRVCLGETLAKNDLFLICGGLLQKLKFKADPDNFPSRKMADNADFIMRLEKPYTVYVEKR